MNYEQVPDGTYYEVDGNLLPVTPNYGYFIGLRENTRAGQRAPFLGVWVSSDGERFIDPVRWVSDRSKAIELGKKHTQLAIWDCANAVEIYLHSEELANV